MSEAINCTSCGAANQLPEGKNSMFCAFCGSAIETKKVVVESKKQESSIKIKPEISKAIRRTHYGGPIQNERGEWVTEQWEVETQEGGKLSLINRNIRSFEEIIVWFTDNELAEIKKLNLNDNKIENFNGIERFSNLEYIDLTNNLISDLPEKDRVLLHSGNIILDRNPIEKTITYEQRGYYTNMKISSLPEVKEKHVCVKCKKEVTYYTKNLGGRCKECYAVDVAPPKAVENKVSIEKRNTQPSLAKLTANEISGGKCFIATATMGSYNHPTVIELRHFRDDWILEKSWGTGFVKWYYHYGAKAAKVIEKSFLLKKICYLLIVKPLYILSKIVKK